MSARNAAITCASARGERFAAIFDAGAFEELPPPEVPADPLKLPRREALCRRLNDARAKTGRVDALSAARGTIDGLPVMIAVQPFDFLGGSLGMAVGEGAGAARCRPRLRESRPFILFVSSGGARMQEGILSLMQMPRVTIGVDMLREAGLPYIVVLTDPTTGGVSASYAMLGDVQIAEPGALIGFAGQRVMRADDPRTAAGRFPARGISAGTRHDRHGRPPPRVARHAVASLLHLLMKRVASAIASRAVPPIVGHGQPASSTRAQVAGAKAAERAASRENGRHQKRRCSRTSADASSQEDRSGAGPHPAAAGRARPSQNETAAGHPRRRHQRQRLGLRLQPRHAGSAGAARARLHLAASGALPRAHPLAGS